MEYNEGMSRCQEGKRIAAAPNIGVTTYKVFPCPVPHYHLRLDYDVD